MLNIMSRNVVMGSHHVPSTNVKLEGKLDDNHQISTTWILNKNLKEKELNQCISEIKTFCGMFGLSVSSNEKYHLNVTGNTKGFNRALQIQIHNYRDTDGDIYYASPYPIKIPSIWTGKLDNILGLNTQKIAHPYFHILDQSKDVNANVTTTFNPLQLAALYNFPTGLDGTGQKIGIIELGGGYVLSDITTYLSRLGITTTPNITSVSVDGAVNNPSDTSGASVEVILDTEVIVALVPDAIIRVYFAPNSFQGFYNAINRAAIDGCSIISISWGASENNWSPNNLSAYNSLFQSITANRNVTVFAAAGDNGSSDGSPGTNVDFPASSPYVVACGGTTLVASTDTTIASETVWNNNSTSSATGGGLSAYFTTPSYQSSLTYPLNGHRGVPDISGNANPNTGYVLYMNGQNIVVGGTSAVSPLWSGLLARVAQSIGHSVGFLQPTIYNNPSAFRDITSGNNGAFSAGTRWDACTGYGSPNGVNLLNLFNNNTGPIAPVAAFNANVTSGTVPLSVTFTDQSSNSPTGWAWNFGDTTNNTSTSQNPQHTYNNPGTYTITLTATNSGGSDSLTRTNYISVNSAPVSPPSPVASFTATPLTGTRPLVVQFTNNSTNGTSYLWNFGDNTTSSSSSSSFNHTYSVAGTFTVSLRATNSTSNNTMTRQNYVRVNNPPLTANFTSNVVSGRRPLTVRFTDSSTGSPTRWSWSFGNGRTSTIQNPTIVYANSGRYTVRLTVSNGSTTSSITKTRYINVSN